MSVSPSNPLELPRDRVPEARWFADEVHRHELALKAYLRGSFPSVRDIDDVVQESYLRVWRARLAHPIHSTKSFLFQVARHLALDLVRRDRVSPIDQGWPVRLG
jgi:RNA polymerase sigma-70 factor (ECF subfamily)